MENFKFKKSLGQNFLQDENVIHKIVDSANLDKDTLLIEIGPGGGAITRYTVPLCGYALLYEADGRLEENLNKLLKENNNYSILIGDFLKSDLKGDIKKYKFSKIYVVANLPYYITTPIIMKFIESDVFPDKMIVMVQKEVASRLSARVGSRDYGSLTVFLDYYYDIRKLFDVSRNCFFPKPNVDSAIVQFSLKQEREKVLDIELFKQLVRDSFSHKRKNIRNNLKNYDLKIIEDVLLKYGFDFGVRAESLSLEVFVEMANFLAKK